MREFGFYPRLFCVTDQCIYFKIWLTAMFTYRDGPVCDNLKIYISSSQAMDEEDKKALNEVRST